MDHATAVRGLREIADFIEARPEMMVPTGINLGNYRDKPELFYQPNGKDGMANIAQNAHVKLEKIVNDSFYKLKFDQPAFFAEAYEYRQNVCEKVLVGTEVEPEHIIPAQPEQIVPARIVPKYEYRCPSLLAPDEEPTAA